MSRNYTYIRLVHSHASSSIFPKLSKVKNTSPLTQQNPQAMPPHDPLDPDLILPADPIEDMYAVHLQDSPPPVQHLIFHPTPPTGPPDPPYQFPVRASPPPPDPHTPGIGAERGRTTSKLELGAVEPHTTCVACERARNSAVTRDGRCVCESTREVLSVQGMESRPMRTCGHLRCWCGNALARGSG